MWKYTLYDSDTFHVVFLPFSSASYRPTILKKVHKKERYGQLKYVSWYLDTIYTELASNVVTVNDLRARLNVTVATLRYGKSCAISQCKLRSNTMTNKRRVTTCV